MELTIELGGHDTMSETQSLLVTVPAHFDGVEIKLDVGLHLKPGTRLLVTILDETHSHEALVWDAMQLSEASFARVWDNEEDAIYDNL
jgi:hypothetical protein